jgi:hypothetical protein
MIPIVKTLFLANSGRASHCNFYYIVWSYIQIDYRISSEIFIEKTIKAVKSNIVLVSKS